MGMELLDMSLLTREQRNEPSYSIWAKMPLWNLRQTCFLISGLDPDVITDEEFFSKFNEFNCGILKLMACGLYAKRENRKPQHVLEWMLRKQTELPPDLVRETKKIYSSAYKMYGDYLNEQDGRGKNFEITRLYICRAALEILGQPPEEYEISLRKSNGQVHLENLASLIERNKSKWPELANDPWGSSYANIRNVLSNVFSKKDAPKPQLVSVKPPKMEA
jgi:hypothetical protein